MHTLVKSSAEYSDCQVIVNDNVEREPGSQTTVKCKLRGEVKSHGKKSVGSGKGKTLGLTDRVPERNMTTNIINPTNKKLILNPDTLIGWLEFVPRKKEPMIVILSIIYKEEKTKKEEAIKKKQV